MPMPVAGPETRLNLHALETGCCAGHTAPGLLGHPSGSVLWLSVGFGGLLDGGR